MTSYRSWLLVGLIIAFCTATALAGDPPARVARISYLSGQVSIQPGGVNDWVQASINRPLTSSDRVWADKDSRAELQLGGASLRLDSDTSMTLVNVSDNSIQVQVDQGVVNFHVSDLFDGQVYEVDTPNVSFIVRKRGDYRFDVDNAGDTTSVTAFRGEGDATGDGPAVRVKSEERYTFTDGKSLRYTVNHNPAPDGFDQWAWARAEREDRAVSARYVSPYAVGYSDLDYYGHWVVVAPYGPMWFPNAVAVGWAPYRYGHWIWVSPWGWTWVDDAPWGFAPFHYGRWVYYRNSWGWCPGPYRYRPIYAPALVAWVGGPNWGLGLSFGVGGGVGWFPLGWGEPYIPYYRHSRGYFRNVNFTNTRFTNVTIINNYYSHPDRDHFRYAYRAMPNAVTVVSNDTFRMARPTRDAIVRVPKSALERARVEANVPLRPTTNSILGSHAGMHSPAPPTMWNRRGDRAMEANASRPDHNMNRGPAANVSDKNGWNNGRASVPRPPERGAQSSADVERPHGIPNPNRGNEAGNGRASFPDRVPRPPDGTRAGRSDMSANSTVTHPTPARTERTSADYLPDRVPRPPQGQVGRPDRYSNADRGPREEAPRLNAERNNVPRPQGQPVRPPDYGNQGVTREMRPQGPPAREDRVPSPPSASRQAEPARQAPANRPASERNAQPNHRNEKVDRENVGRESSVRYPRPYGNIRPASYAAPESSRMSYANTRSDYSPRSYNRPSYSSSYDRNYTSATRSWSRSYSSGRAYSESPRSYAQSYRSYSAPARSYSQPSRNMSYSRGSYGGGNSHSVSRSYSQPSRTYARSSGGGDHGGSSHGRSR